MDERMSSLLNIYGSLNPKEAERLRNNLEKAERQEAKVIIFLILLALIGGIGLVCLILN
jgi:hypothetical protein